MGPSVPEGGCRGKRGWRRGRYAGVYALERPQGANGRPGEISKCTCTGTCTDISPLAEAKAARALVQRLLSTGFAGLETNTIWIDIRTRRFWWEARHERAGGAAG